MTHGTHISLLSRTKVLAMLWRIGSFRAVQNRLASLRWAQSRPLSFIGGITSKRSNHGLLAGTGVFVLVGGSLMWDGRESNSTKCHGIPSKDNRQKIKGFIQSSLSRSDLKALPEYTLADVSQRNGEDGGPIWMSYGGYVYSVKDFIPLHPGGTERISRAAGTAIEPFWYLHQQHFDTEEPMQIMKGLVVGKLAQSDQEKVDAQLESLQQEVEGFQLVVDLSGLEGSVAKLSLDDLKRLPKTDIKSQVGCPSNQDRRPISTSIFGGVRMKELLGQAPNGAIRQLTFHAMDGEKVAVQVDQHEDILVCYEMDGAPLTKKRGFPLRVIIPGKRAVKWVQRVDVGGDSE